MVVEMDCNGDICILRMRGRFSTGRDSLYLHTRADEIKATGCRKILADFTQVTYLDSTGIGFLIGLYTSVSKGQDGAFVIAGANDRVLEVLKLTRLTHILRTYPDENAGMQALAARGQSA